MSAYRPRFRKAIALLTALSLALASAVPALCGGYTLDRATGKVTVTGKPYTSGYFGNYNFFQAYRNLQTNTDHVDYVDDATVQSDDFPAGTIKSIDVKLAASGVYSINGAVNMLVGVPMSANIASADFEEAFSPWSPAVFVIGGQEVFASVGVGAAFVGSTGWFFSMPQNNPPPY